MKGSLILIDRLEKKFGRYAIPHLIRYVIVLYALGFILMLTAPQVYYAYFALDAEKILHGQIWRIFTFLMNAPNSSPIFIIFTLYFYYIMGKVLEQQWGSFRFNLYYFTGVIGTVIASIIVYLITGLSGPYLFYMDTYYINISLLLAFATVAPNMRVLIMFLIPVKMKWLAYLDAAYLIFIMIMGDWGTRVSILVALANFILYYFAFMRGHGNLRQAYRRYTYRQAAGPRFQGGMPSGQSQSFRQEPPVRSFTPSDRPIHRCAICGRTEKDGDFLEFRFCSRCNGNYEYCQDHLFTHTHVK